MIPRLTGEKPKTAGPLEQEEGSDEFETINRVFAALTYEGFDVLKVREKAINSMTFPTLKILISTYIMTGNSLTKRISKNKVVDKAMAMSISQTMKKLGIKDKATGSSDLSLPRLAIAFPALVIAIRIKAPKTIRVETSTPWELQDLCLNGYASTIAAAGCEDFIQKFSILLAKARSKDTKEEDVRASVENFRQLGKTSLTRDPVGLKMLEKKITGDMKLSDLAIGDGFPKDKLKTRVALPDAPVTEPANSSVEEEEQVIQQVAAGTEDME